MSVHNIRFSSILLCFILISCESSKIDFLIPSDYAGSVVVIYNQENGSVEKKTEDGVRVYQIPESGVLFTQSKRLSGALSINFWYVNRDGQKLREIFSEYKALSNKNDEILVSKIIDGQFSLNPDTNADRTSYNDALAHKIKFIYFYIGKQGNIENGLIEANQVLTDITRSMTIN